MAHQASLLETFDSLGHPRVLVIGDLILDRYTWGNAERVSQEAPVILLRTDHREARLGGAANVCNMLAGLEAEVACAGVIGSDADGRELVALLGAAPAFAGEAPPAADDPVLEARLMKLSAELRCLVCQNQSLADSHADLAIDLRNQVREQMRAGRSDAEIRDWLTQRYGDFVLYRPPLKTSTVLLWVGPLVLLLVAVTALLITVRRRRRRPATELTPEEQARAEQLLRTGSDLPNS